MATTTKVIVYTRSDGRVAVTSPSPSFMAPSATEQEGLDALQAIAVPRGATNAVQCELSALPTSRRFRNGWRQIGAAPPTEPAP